MSLKLLSFVLSFQKRKCIKERGLQEIFVLMIPARLALQTPSVIFSRKCQLPLLGEACKGAPHRLHIPLLGEACKGASHRLHIPQSGRQKILVRPPFPQAQKSRTNRNNPARSAPFFLQKRPPPGGFFNFRKNFLKICYLSHPFCGYYRCKALLRSGKEETLWRTKK